ncbi:MAG TPA: MBL fold metallo-hydrolase [Phycisphaerae bacterium]|nr:MBL fold metallo-hydrolase [Phycisphaerae bacterium]
MSSELTVTVMGSGTSAGVPMIGCHCAVCTSGDPRDKRTRPSIAVSYEGEGRERTILVDTTPELRLQAVANRIDRIDAVVYTHAHADHIFGLDDVRRYNTLLAGPLPLYAAEDALATLRRSFAYAFETHERTGDALYRPELAPRIIDGPFDLFGKSWTSVPLIHGRFRVLGFRVDNFAYCTDCNQIPPDSRALLQNLDVLIIDGLRPRPHPTHLSFEQALDIIADLKPRRAFFTHLSHDMKHADLEASLPPHVRVCYDGLRIPL